jgi:hypothetical protein
MGRPPQALVLSLTMDWPLASDLLSTMKTLAVVLLPHLQLPFYRLMRCYIHVRLRGRGRPDRLLRLIVPSLPVLPRHLHPHVHGIRALKRQQHRLFLVLTLVVTIQLTLTPPRLYNEAKPPSHKWDKPGRMICCRVLHANPVRAYLCSQAQRL